MTETSVAPSSDHSVRTRILGIDVARALAILGMLAVHVGPTNVGGPLGRLYALPHGRASLLFVLVAGVGVSLLVGSRSSKLHDPRLRLAWRAALLLPLGLALQGLDHQVNVILQSYALLFVVALVAVTWSDRSVLSVAAASAGIGPMVFWWGQATAPEVFARRANTLADAPGDILHGLVLSGPYPLITWLAPFLLGIWVGRQDLRSRRLRRRFVVVGGSVALAASLLSRLAVALIDGPIVPDSPAYLVSSVAHGQMPLWILGGTGAALFVFGVALIVADAAPPVTWPLAASGQLALTAYVGHILALSAAPNALTSDQLGDAIMLLAVFFAVIATGSLAWRSLFGRGPLEIAFQAPWILADLTAELKLDRRQREWSPGRSARPSSRPPPR